jgi:hypothetical protein
MRRAEEVDLQLLAGSDHLPIRKGCDDRSAMNRLATMRVALTSEPLGWHARLFREWVLYNAIAFTIILGTVYLLAGTSLDVTRQAVGHLVATLLIALFGALLYAIVLGTLQWRVLRQRITIPRRRWIGVCVGPGLLAWLVTVLPSVTHAASAGGDVQAAYLLAVSQALAYGPLLGFSQAFALRPYTRRWAWWIAANVVSWLVVDGAVYLFSLVFNGLDFVREDGSVAEVYAMLILTTPLTGRWVLWVTAHDALSPPTKEGARRENLKPQR